MCVCVRETDRHTDRQRECICEYVYVGACVCVCARVRARVCARMRVCTLAPNLDEATSHINYLIIKLNLQNKLSTTSRALFATIERTLFFFFPHHLPPFFFFPAVFFFFFNFAVIFIRLDPFKQLHHTKNTLVFHGS